MGRRGRSKERTPEYFTVDVERLDQEGRGIAHLDGKVVFIQGALPGERVTYERLRSKSSFDIGRTSAVLTQSWARVAPRCPKFGFGPGSCGGCTMQHIEPNAQVAFKERILMDTLWHIGKVKPEKRSAAHSRTFLELPPSCTPDGSRCCQKGRCFGGIPRKGFELCVRYACLPDSDAERFRHD